MTTKPYEEMTEDDEVAFGITKKDFEKIVEELAAEEDDCMDMEP